MYKNSEQYSDPTAGLALAHIAYQERQKRRQAVWMKISLIYKHLSAPASSSSKKASPPLFFITTVPENSHYPLDTDIGVNE